MLLDIIFSNTLENIHFVMKLSYLLEIELTAHSNFMIILMYY